MLRIDDAVPAITSSLCFKERIVTAEFSSAVQFDLTLPGGQFAPEYAAELGPAA